ncbi:M1 family metallopeptidase [Actinoallomurus bryophytorum]|uniref:Aminopeptidase N n=1 Tax=Actinoallomurus bryophytorum TaxID=1490222 RepID=A0A543CLC5_9ACTN|nr:M1 family metallopeptidase [Actinoallomurus bryophytorum]TQL97885.1 peptidase M1-like protein [Actinoallomurus bryophytorum]
MRVSPAVLPLFLVAAVTAACSSAPDKGTAHRQRTATPSAPDLATKYAAGRSAPVADTYYPERGHPAVDVLHYDLALTWSPPKKELTGTATLAVRAAAGTDNVTLDFSKRLKIDGVTVDGRPATVKRQSDRLIIPAGKRMAEDATAEVAIRYHGRPKEARFDAIRPDSRRVGFAVHRDGSAVALQEPYGAFTWYPSNDQPSDKALYDVAITVPKGWAGVSSGTFQGKVAQGDSTVYRWHSGDPTASYLVTFVADRLTMVKQTGPHGLPITYWLRAKDRKKNLATMRQSPKIIAWLEKRLGPYPFPSAGAVIAGDSGMETQQMITLMSGLPPEVYAHEYAHQWFGDTVTPRTWQDVWLNEGFAEYFEILYFAEYDPRALPFEQVMTKIRRDQDGTLRHDYGPPGHYKKRAFASPNVYLSPAVMLDEMRKKVGDKKFYAMLRGWAQEHRSTNQDRDTFAAWVKQSTGKDLTPLINHWLDSKTTPAV